MDFPPEYDEKIYRIYDDLKHFDSVKLFEHFCIHGKKEGRLSNIMSREYLKIFDVKKCLEIGPFDNPFFRGENIKYFDVLNKDDLIKRAIEHNRHGDVPFIHYVSSTGDLTVVNEKFDTVFSSHCIEHQPDFIEHLIKVGDILNEGGKYIIICPDKRYCFDHFIPETYISEIIVAHEERRTKHTLKAVIEHLSLITHNDAYQHWIGNHGSINYDHEKVKDIIKKYYESDYIDVHGLQFTPDSFKNIITFLSDNQIIPFRIYRCYHTKYAEFEFICILEKK